jgi:hypothetical protein
MDIYVHVNLTEFFATYVNISDSTQTCDDVNNTAEIIQKDDIDITSSMIIDRSSLPGQEGSRSNGWSSENIIMCCLDDSKGYPLVDTSEISVLQCVFPYIQPSHLLLCNTAHNVILPV